MAYAAVISLKQTIQRLLNSCDISVVSSSRDILEFVYNEVESLQRVLERLDDSSSRSSKRLDALDGQIRDAVQKLEDVLEFHESDQFFSQSESYGDDEGSSHTLSLDLDEVTRQEINSFAEIAKKMEEEYTEELGNPLPEEEEDDDDDDDDAAVSSSTDSGVDLVGLSTEYAFLKEFLLRRVRPDDLGFFSIVGRAGTGRTLAAKALFEDLYIGQEQSLDCGAWVTIGPKYQFKEIFVSIVAQINDHKLLNISEGDDEKLLAEYLYTSLKGRRYMIVLDDVCDTEIWDKLKSSFPEQDNGSLVLLTTSLMEVALFANSFYTLEYRAVSDEQIWDLFRFLMFEKEMPCPPELEDAGKKIARNCRGVGFPVLKAVLFLMKDEKTPEYWNKLAADEENSIFRAKDEISEILKIKEELRLYPDDDKRASAIKYALEPSNPCYSIDTIKVHMFPERLFPKMEITSLVGMAGIGKTALVKKIFEDRSILCHFDHCVWITLGPKYKSEDIWVDILARIYPDNDKMHIQGDEKLATDLCEGLSYKRCLIVLDDVWNKKPLHYLRKLLPAIKGKALVTSRLVEATEFGKQDKFHEMQLLNEEESWCLLRQTVFAEELCPPELEKAGKKIAKYCEGLPLMILTVADLLSKAAKTPEYWNKVAEKQNSVFVDAYDRMSKVLSPSYDYLPQHLKACFLYMGIFPENYDISITQFMTLWTAEGFLEPNPNQTVEEFALQCVFELTSRYLVMIHRKGSNYEFKSFCLHSVFWHLSNREAMKNKFFCALNTCADNSTHGIKSQRRLCIRKSILLGMKNVHSSMASIPTVRSLLCTGPSHPFPVPICLGLRLLRVLDALAIRFYQFPIEVVELIHLRYLGLTCNGKLPASISELRNLQHLLIRRYLSITSSENSSHLPVEIWDMKELKHLQVTGGRLPNPNNGAILPNLLTLLDVSADSCTKEVIKGIPNLMRLGIKIELACDDDDGGGGNHFHFLNEISCLSGLSALKYALVNPKLRSNVVAPPIPVSMFPSSLVRLILSGHGYPSAYMSIIGELKNLETLKLRCYAFRGPEWGTDCFSFNKLKFLSIEDTDLVRWKDKLDFYRDLECLSLKHCYKLEKLPHFLSIKMIEVDDCSPYTMAWAKQMEEKNLPDPLTSRTLQLQVHSSWDAGNLKQ